MQHDKNRNQTNRETTSTKTDATSPTGQIEDQRRNLPDGRRSLLRVQVPGSQFRGDVTATSLPTRPVYDVCQLSPVNLDCAFARSRTRFT